MYVRKWRESFPRFAIMGINRGGCRTMKGNEQAWYAAFKSKDEGWRPWRGYAAVNLWNSLKQ